MGVPKTSALSTVAKTPKVIDSHLHVWANTEESKAFPYIVEPPDSLKDTSSTAALLEQMKEAGVDGCLVVQPINHKFDHSYVTKAMKDYPDKFKGMLLYDPSPSISPEQAVSKLEELTLQGYCGVRFNPYLFEPKDENDETEKRLVMSRSEAAMAVYKRCADLHAPVGVMCFKGLDLHFDDIVAMLEASPKTNMILDHFAFTSLATDQGNENFKSLLSLAKYPQVYVKISAFFRVDPDGAKAAAEDGFSTSNSYNKLKSERLDALLDAFGAKRLMFGTDFPFILDQPGGYKGSVDLVRSWLSDEDYASVMSGTIESLFGQWGSSEKEEL